MRIFLYAGFCKQRIKWFQLPFQQHLAQNVVLLEVNAGGKRPRQQVPHASVAHFAGIARQCFPPHGVGKRPHKFWHGGLKNPAAVLQFRVHPLQNRQQIFLRFQMVDAVHQQIFLRPAGFLQIAVNKP